MDSSFSSQSDTSGNTVLQTPLGEGGQPEPFMSTYIFRNNVGNMARELLVSCFREKWAVGTQTKNPWKLYDIMNKPLKLSIGKKRNWKLRENRTALLLFIPLLTSFWRLAISECRLWVLGNLLEAWGRHGKCRVYSRWVLDLIHSFLCASKNIFWLVLRI